MTSFGISTSRAVLSVLAIASTLSAAVPAQAASYRLDLTRNGVAQKMVVYNFWSGEYPGPVVVMGKSNRGYTKIVGSVSMRTPDQTASCEVKNGIYHPWSETQPAFEMFTVVGATEFTALKATEVSYIKDGPEVATIALAAGDKIVDMVYLSEGYCRFKVASTSQEIDADCPQVDGNANFQRVDMPAHPSEQWLKLQCKGGGSIYAETDSLLKQKGVSEGKNADFGSVSR